MIRAFRAPFLATRPGGSGLTARQTAILTLSAEGRNVSEVALELGYAVGTIKSELRQIGRQLGARNRTHAVALAIRAGLI